MLWMVGAIALSLEDGNDIQPEDVERFQAWVKGLPALGLKSEEIDSNSWRLLGNDNSLIAVITYDATKPFRDRFSFSVPPGNK
jgi:hypothetical protein